MSHRFSFRRWIRSSLFGVVALSLTAVPALAQFGGGGFRQISEPDVDTLQIEIIGEMLAFSDEQNDLAIELLQGYLSEVSDMAEQVRAITDGARQEFRETRDPSVWQDVMAAMGPLNDQKDQITERFMEDLQLILNEDQFKRWDEVERFHRRYTSFSDDGLLSGETVDVIQAVNDMDLPEEDMAALKPILDQYALELDRALIERNKAYEEGMSRGMELWRSGDMEQIQKLFDDARDKAERVRDINRRYAKQVEQTLDPAFAGEWVREFKEQSFPRVYRPSPTERAIDTAMEFEDLTADQREQIMTLRREYASRVESMNDEIAKAIEDGEMSRGIEMFFGRGRRGGGDQDELREVRNAKQEYDTTVMTKLRSMLTNEQLVRLPEREDNRDWRDRLPNRRGGGDRPREL
ncbi:MAG: hypothetical protein Tsb0013_00200 [Phycisphaerales bacterium]